MIETITPSVCGSRKRHRIAIVAFTVSAVGAAALLGAALGLAGAFLGAREAVLAVAALAALAAARELGLVRFPLPQARRQVPERWHHELPLPLWAAGYGAGLGAGFATYQPVATFWVACAAAFALGRPLPAALAFSVYGVGRALMVVLPKARQPDATTAVETLVGRRPALVRANGVVLALSAVALALVPAAGAEPVDLGAGSQLDPSPSRGVLAYTQRDEDETSVVVRVSPVDVVRFPAARAPSLDRDLLAYVDDAGVRVVRWRSGAHVARIPAASHAALAWPWLAYRTTTLGGSQELYLRNLRTRRTRRLARAGPWLELGRPTVAGGRVAWSVAGAAGSRIVLYTIATGGRTTFARSKIALLAFPSLSASRMVWVDGRAAGSYLRLRRLDRPGVTTLARTYGADEGFWTTGLAARSAFATVWYESLGATYIERFRF